VTKLHHFVAQSHCATNLPRQLSTFHRHNKITHNDALPMLDLRSIFQSVSKSGFISLCDCCSAYWQFETKESDHWLSMFVCETARQTNMASSNTDDDKLCTTNHIFTLFNKSNSSHVNKQLTNHSSATERENDKEQIRLLSRKLVVRLIKSSETC